MDWHTFCHYLKMDNTIIYLQNALHYGFARQSVIAHNIANSNTPNFKTLDLLPDFESDTARHPELGSGSNLKLFKVPYTGVTNLDGNNVNIEMESMKSMYTTMYTQTILDFLRSKFNSMKQAITERVV